MQGSSLLLVKRLMNLTGLDLDDAVHDQSRRRFTENQTSQVVTAHGWRHVPNVTRLTERMRT